LGPLQPHGIAKFSWNVQPGTGQRRTGQSPGLVVLVIVGHGVVVGLGGRVVTPVLMVGRVVVVVLVGVVVVVCLVVGRRVIRLDDVVDDPHGSCAVRNWTPQPLYGQSAWQGAISVAVGTDDGQPHGLLMVETN
jgi:hypothetical protein